MTPAQEHHIAMMLLQIELDKNLFVISMTKLRTSNRLFFYTERTKPQQIIVNKYTLPGFHYHEDIDLIDHNIAHIEEMTAKMLSNPKPNQDPIITNHAIRQLDGTKLALMTNLINLSFSQN